MHNLVGKDKKRRTNFFSLSPGYVWPDHNVCAEMSVDVSISLRLHLLVFCLNKFAGFGILLLENGISDRSAMGDL